MRFRTKQIHAGVTPDAETGAILTPIHQTTTFVQPSVDELLETLRYAPGVTGAEHSMEVA